MPVCVNTSSVSLLNSVTKNGALKLQKKKGKKKEIYIRADPIFPRAECKRVDKFYAARAELISINSI